MTAEAFDVLELAAKGKEYGTLFVIFLVLLKYSGWVLRFFLDRLGIKLTRRQTVEERLASVENEVAILRANFGVVTETVTGIARAMRRRLTKLGIEDEPLWEFVRRLEAVKRLEDLFPESKPSARSLTPATSSPPDPPE